MWLRVCVCIAEIPLLYMSAKLKVKTQRMLVHSSIYL